MRLAYALVVPVLIIPTLADPPEAAADCTSVSGTTLCSQGTSRGSDTGAGPGVGGGPTVPYPCAWGDYACDDWWGVNFDLDLDPGPPGRPGGPGIGGPGGPGGPGLGPGGGPNRPGGGGRPGGGRGGGRR